jgi:chemotaxis protein methyltransferase CheR
MITPPLSTKEFRLFQSLVRSEAGIALSDQNRALLVGRLAPRLRALDLASFGDYFEFVNRDAAERVRMLDCICTNETSFFREPKQFAFLEEQVLPRWRAEADSGERRREVRVWSAGCSTGEEPYSIAMSLVANLPSWRVEVIATDLSTKVLERAEAAVWPIERAANIPVHYRKAFLLRGDGPQAGRITVRPELASHVRFARVNLHDDSYPVTGRFDLIFCRNVLIYFDAAGKQRVMQRLLDRLQPDGFFFLGHSETFNTCERVRSVGPTVYALREDA